MYEDSIYNIVIDVVETEEEFIFKTIQLFCEQVIETKISKKELVNALKEKGRVEFSDDDHVWINGKQFISLKRFLELKNDMIKEYGL